MFERLKKWLGGSEPKAAPQPSPAARPATGAAKKPTAPAKSAPAPAPKTAAAPADVVVIASPRSGAPAAAASPAAPAPTPAAASPAPATAAAAQVAPTPTPLAAVNPDEVALPWAAVLAKWPEPVRLALADERMAQAIHLPLAALEPGIKRGKLAFPWGQLCRYVRPRSSTLTGAVPEDSVVEIPLAIAVPLFLQRAAPTVNRRERAVPTEIPDLFTPPTPGAAPVAEPEVAPAVKASAPPEPPPAPIPPPPTESVVKPPAAPPAPEPVSKPIPAAGLPQPANRPIPAAHLPEPASRPTGPLPAVSPAPPSPRPVAAAPVPGADVVVVPWAPVVAKWTEAQRQAVAEETTIDSIHFPLAEFEPALKRGWLAFPWSQICQYIQPPSATLAGRMAGGEVVEVPLPVAVPCFLSRGTPVRKQQERVVPANVPDLFAVPAAQKAPAPTAPAAVPAPTPVPAATPAAPTPEPALAAVSPPPSPPAPVAAPPPAPTPVPEPRTSDLAPGAEPRIPAPAALASLAIAPVGAQPPIPAPVPAAAPPEPAPAPAPAPPTISAEAPAKVPAAPPAVVIPPEEPEEEGKEYEPAEFVEHVANLPGVEGAALASADGLLVASRLSEEVDGNTVAAFLPRLFKEAFANARAFHVSRSDSVVYVFPEMTLAVMKVDGHYLAAVGRSIKSMAVARLADVARNATLGRGKRESRTA